MDNKIVVMYRVKRYLKILSIALLFLLIGLVIYEYIRIRPRDVNFTNISSSSVTVSWTTSTPMKGYATVVDVKDVLPISFFTLGKELSYDTRDYKNAELLNAVKTAENISESSENSVTIDKIETEIKVEQVGKYYTHHVEIRNLNPESEYKIMVGDGLMFTKVADITDNNVVKTKTIAENIVTPIPIYGSVRDAQNEEKHIADLTPVDDAIIYFNYLDEATEVRSQVISGSLNEEGNWYLDISGALDESGENFIEKYQEKGATNILGELIINAGSLGIWKKIIYMHESAPTETVVINSPNTNGTEEMKNSVVRIDTLKKDESVVKGANAMEDGCLWISFCGCGKSINGSWVDCDCDPNVLASRGCTSEQSAQEAVTSISSPSTGCAGGGALNDQVLYGGNCKTCVQATNGTYYWKDTPGVCDTSKMTDGVPITPSEQKTTNEGTTNQTCTGTTTQSVLNSAEVGLPCCLNGTEGKIANVSGKNQCSVPMPDKDLDEIVMDSLTVKQLCTDPDGCVCLYGYNKSTSKAESSITIKQNQFCEVKVISPLVLCDKTGGTLNSTGVCNCEIEKVFDTKLGCVDRSSNPIKVGEKCTTSVSKYPNNGTIDSSGECKKNPENGRCTIVQNGLSYNYASYDQYGVCQPLGSCNGTWIRLSDEWVCKATPTLVETFPIKDPIEECWKKDTSQILYRIDKDKKIYICLNNTWKETNLETLPSTGNDPRNTLDLSSYYYFNENGDLIHNIQGLGYPADDSAKEVFAMEITILGPGKLCSTEDNKGCLCKGGYDNNEYIANGETCIDVYSCWISIGGEHTRDGRVCRRDGKVCDGNNCVDPSSVKGINSKIETTSKIYAQTEDNTNTFILDPQTGMVGGLEEGSYIFEYQGKTYLFSINTGNLTNGKILVYIDNNANSIYDEDVDTKITDLASKIEITPIKQTYKYTLKEGFNFISLPFLISNNESKTAAGLLSNLNDVYNNSIYSISKYDGKWKVVGQNSKVYDNNDFQLIPGQGYIIKASRDVTISIVGQPIKFDSKADSAAVTLLKGWNLIGLYGTGIKSYTAKSLIQDINNYKNPDFTADNVTRWESDIQRYDGYQLTKENGIDMEYGFDYPINLLQGYFVRITQGNGNWQPEFK